MDLTNVNHPCFNVKARKKFGRVHLPVAPRCNIQCKFCNRKFDCVNESRPGVTSGILSPYQALVYLEHVFEARKNIAVVGIAGPGDPFANAEETLETMELVRAKYPEIILCLATNGLGIVPHLDRLAEIGVGHVTVTVNAVDLDIAEKVYSWIRWGKKALRAKEGVKILLEQQLAAIKGLKERGIMVKVNSILIPGVNDTHVAEVAEVMAGLGVDIFNCLPFHKNDGCAFGDMEEPSKELLHKVRKEAGRHIKQMTHCQRCRADAVGCLGEESGDDLMKKLKACEAMPERPDNQAPAVAAAAATAEKAHDNKKHGEGDTCHSTPLDLTGTLTSESASSMPAGEKPHVAVASMEGVLVNQHLGEAVHLLVYKMEEGRPVLIDRRKTPEAGAGPLRWKRLAEMVSDCGTLLVSGVGPTPKAYLENRGLAVHVIEGVIEEAVGAVLNGTGVAHLRKREMKGCGMACSGTGGGCG